MQAKNVRIFNNIPTKAALEKLIEDFKAENPKQLGWVQQADGSYYLEILLSDDRQVGESLLDGRILILE